MKLYAVRPCYVEAFEFVDQWTSLEDVQRLGGHIGFDGLAVFSREANLVYARPGQFVFRGFGGHVAVMDRGEFLGRFGPILPCVPNVPHV